MLIFRFWGPQSCVSALCRWCDSVGFIRPWPSAPTGVVCSRGWSGRDESQNLQVWWYVSTGSVLSTLPIHSLCTVSSHAMHSGSVAAQFERRIVTTPFLICIKLRERADSPSSAAAWASGSPSGSSRWRGLTSPPPQIPTRASALPISSGRRPCSCARPGPTLEVAVTPDRSE